MSFFHLAEQDMQPVRIQRTLAHKTRGLLAVQHASEHAPGLVGLPHICEQGRKYSAKPMAYCTGDADWKVQHLRGGKVAVRQDVQQSFTAKSGRICGIAGCVHQAGFAVRTGRQGRKRRNTAVHAVQGFCQGFRCCWEDGRIYLLAAQKATHQTEHAPVAVQAQTIRRCISLVWLEQICQQSSCQQQQTSHHPKQHHAILLQIRF